MTSILIVFSLWLPYDEAVKHYTKHKPLVILITASWCKYCPQAASNMEALYKRRYFNQIAITKVDADSPYGRELMGTSSIPCFIIFKRGKETERIVGYDEKKLTKVLEDFLK